MATDRASSGDVVALRPFHGAGAEGHSVALVRDEKLEVMRLVLPRDKRIPEHRAYGPLTLHCLEGSVVVGLGGGTEKALHAGELMYLAAGAPHDVRAADESVVLVTMVLQPEAAMGDGAPPGEPVHGDRTSS